LVFNRKNKEKEFVDCINKHRGILHKIALLYSDNEFDKQDLYQEVLLQLWKSYPTFNGHSKFSSWMYRVALNTAIGFTQKKSLISNQSNRKSDFYDMEKSMELSEDVKILYKAISRLKKVDKAIILMWLEDRPYGEISETIGISIKNVSVKLVRIKRHLTDVINTMNDYAQN